MAEKVILGYSALLPEKKRVKVQRTVEFEPIKAEPGSVKKRKRVGRGRSAGQGKTAGRGQKGQKARAGYSAKPGFEGGQMPLKQRLPKRGFTNIFKKEFQLVNLWALDKANLKGDVTAKELYSHGLIDFEKKPVKILGSGSVKAALNITADAFSSSAKESIEKAGGKCRLKNEGKKKLRRFPKKVRPAKAG